ncbi:MAG TPA: alginate lyase family protein [Candidatus Limnocylindria bacterium]|nr:alginate lyase family protein [Candidatus Limnocylindria bacterium]
MGAAATLAGGFVVMQVAFSGPAESDRHGAPPQSAEPRQPSPSTARVDGGYLISATELADRARQAEAGIEPYRSALDQLMAEADRALEGEPRPVNPLSRRDDRFLRDTRDAYTLALAWVASGQERYAERSADFINAWATNVDETRDTCRESGGRDCVTSLVVSRSAPAFVFAADLLAGADAWSTADDLRFKDWLADVVLPAASHRTNNWGDAGTFMRLVVADYVGDTNEFRSAIDDWRSLMDLVTSAGQIPEETRRGSLGLLYTQGAISYKAAAAAIAARRGVDLWTYEGALGGTLRDAIDTLTRYWDDHDAWPWHDGRLDTPSVDPAWEIIYQRWPDQRYARLFAESRPFGAVNPSAIVWTTLTNGVPIEDSQSSSSP